MGTGCTHDRHYTGSLRTQEGPLPEVRQARPTQTDPDPRRSAPSPTRPSPTWRSPTASISRQCDCCTTFRNTPEGVLPKAHYDNKVRDLVLDRILEDGMSIERTLESLRREFLLDLSTGFVYDVLRDRAAATRHGRASPQGPGALQRHALRRRTAPGPLHPAAGHRPAERPAGGLRPGRRPTTRTTCGGSSRTSRTGGLIPEVVVTDGSNLYPAVLAELWPDADHQLCVFHVIKDINKLILDAVRRMRTAMSRRGKAGRKKKRGRKGAKSKAARRPAGPDGQGEGGLRVQASASDREAAGEPHRVGARRPEADAGVPARVGDACGGSPTGSTGCSTRPRTSTRRAAAGPRSSATRRSRPCPSWSRRWSNWMRRSSPS